MIPAKKKKKSSFKTLQFPDKFGQTWANYLFEIAAACFKILTSPVCDQMSYYIPDLGAHQGRNFKFSLLHKKKEMRGQQPWQVLKDRTVGFNIVTPRLFDSVNICAAKTHCKGIQIYILILQGRGFESITLDSFFISIHGFLH